MKPAGPLTRMCPPSLPSGTTQRSLLLLRLPLLLLLGVSTHAPLARAENAATDDAPPPDALFEQIAQEARQLAAEPYSPPASPLPDALKDLPRDATGSITFRPEKSLWADPGIPFRARLYHLGQWFNHPVQVYEVIDGKPHRLGYDPEWFNLNGMPVDTGALPEDLGFAGFSLYVRSPTMNAFHEKLSFLGASYFRAVGTNHHWGSSGRGITINTAIDGTPEEFPAFEKFWVVKPVPNDTTAVIYALLNGPSVAGAYRFEVNPGDWTTVKTRVAVFFRHGSDEADGAGGATPKAGFAPLTSMFLMGEEQRGRFGAWRPEVHDADGLLMVTRDGEHLWRPLDNPDASRVSRFELNNPMGFGLIQRDRDFRSYLDLKHEYHRRPSVWVEANGGGWGKGWVELAEFHSGDEDFDNLAAYWVPADDAAIKSGERFDFSYTLWFCDDSPPLAPGGRFVQTYRGIPEALYPTKRDGQAIRFVLEARGGGLDEPFAGTPEPVVSVTQGRIIGTPTLERNIPMNTWRLTFDAKPDGNEPMELRAFLRRDNDVLTETWLYRWDWGNP